MVELPDIEADGYGIVYHALPPEMVEDALRTVTMTVYEKGLHPADAREWAEKALWFPTLVDAPTIMRVRAELPADGLVWTQIVVQFPVAPDTVDTTPMHVDAPPKWGRYLWIAGVPLTPCDGWHGGVGFDDEGPHELFPGDVVVFGPETKHRSFLNRSGRARVALYFRSVAFD